MAWGEIDRQRHAVGAARQGGEAHSAVCPASRGRPGRLGRLRLQVGAQRRAEVVHIADEQLGHRAGVQHLLDGVHHPVQRRGQAHQEQPVQPPRVVLHAAHIPVSPCPRSSPLCGPPRHHCAAHSADAWHPHDVMLTLAHGSGIRCSDSGTHGRAESGRHKLRL